MNAGVVVASGQSKRMGPLVDKAFFSLGNMPVIAYSLAAFEKCVDIDRVTLVVRRERVESAWGMIKMFGFAKVTRVVVGGALRQISVRNGLEGIGDDVQLVAVHDGARPCVTAELISKTLAAAKRYGSGVAGIQMTDTVKRVERGMHVAETLDRKKIWAVQTPQSFKLPLLLEALDHVKKSKAVVTDEAHALELLQKDVRLVPSSPANIKITTSDDLPLAAALLNA